MLRPTAAFALLLPLFTALTAPAAAQPAPKTYVLFVGNSYTFARVDPVLSYNAANVRDLTQPQGPLHGGTDPTKPFVSGKPFTNLTNTNSYPAGIFNAAEGRHFDSYSPHSQTQAWSGVAGIFKQMTDQAGLDYEVALSSRNGATLRGHFLNAANSNWDLRGNIASQTWGKVVLQEQSDEPLTRQPGLGANPEYSRFYADKIENFVHSTATSGTIRDRDAFAGATSNERQAACVAAGIAAGTCSNNRGSFANDRGSAATEMYLFQTWARPNLINAPGAATIDPATGNATYDTVPPASFFADLESMTADLKASYEAIKDRADDDGTPGFKAIAPVGETFLRAVTSGKATRDMYAPNATTDGLIDLWFNDGTHASVHGSYLSALTLFGTLTGLDPATLGANEIAARDLGISRADAWALQRVASDQLGYMAPIPEPGTWALMLAGLVGTVAAGRRQREQRGKQAATALHAAPLG
jgi:PEP-CTERM motif